MVVVVVVLVSVLILVLVVVDCYLTLFSSKVGLHRCEIMEIISKKA